MKSDLITLTILYAAHRSHGARDGADNFPDSDHTHMIQIRYFPDGGFVLHCLPCPGRALHASAWYDKRGTMHDCEAIHYRQGRRMALPVKRGGPLWQSLAAHGPRHSRTLYVESLA